MEASIQAVSPELICELRMTEGSVVEGAGGAAGVAAGATAAAAPGAGAGADVAAGAGVACGGSAHAEGTDSASRANSNDRDNVIIDISPAVRVVLNGAGAALAGADTHDLLEVEDKNLAIAHFAGPRGVGNCLDHPLRQHIIDRDFDLGFRHELDQVLGPPIDLGVAALPPKASDLGNRHALDSHIGDCFANVFELVWPDDCSDQFHGSKLLPREMRRIAGPMLGSTGFKQARAVPGNGA